MLFRLTRDFSIASLATMVVVALLLGLYSRELTRIDLEDTARAAAGAVARAQLTSVMAAAT